MLLSLGLIAIGFVFLVWGADRFIAGAAAPAGKKMGHAGAIVMGNKGSYVSKRMALERAGVHVVDTPSDVGQTIVTALEQRNQ